MARFLAGSAPDLVLYNGNVVSMNPNCMIHEALAVKNGRFMMVGSTDQVRALRDRQTREMDLQGKTVVPGFIDSHCHMLSYGLGMNKLMLSHAKCIADVLDAVAEQAAKTARGQWIVGLGRHGCWHERQLREERLPTREELDQVAPDHPVYLPRGGQLAAANSRALLVAGIARDTRDPEGGAFQKDSDAGQLTGVLVGKPALERVSALIPRPTLEERVKSLELVSKRLSSVGVTSIAEPGVTYLYPDDIRVYQEVWSTHQLSVRATVMVRIDTSQPLTQILDTIRRGPCTGFGDEMLRIGAIKLFFDGVIETALLREPYVDRPHYYGLQLGSTECFQEIVEAANRNNWQVAVHAVGGAAIGAVLDLFDRASQQEPILDRRFQLIHAFLPTEEDMERCRGLRVVIAAQQPLVYHFGHDMIKYWGRERAARASPHRDWIDAGVTLGGGTDTMPFDPLLAIWGLVTRRTKLAGVLGPEQRISRQEALRMWTIGSAYLMFEDKTRGSIEPGKVADFVVLSDDVLTCAEDAIRDIRVLMTVVGGKTVFTSGGWEEDNVFPPLA